MFSKPFVIAEMSGNHNQSLERALAIVDAAADNGADAIKLQTYTPDTMTLNLNEREFRIEDPKSLWYGRSLYDLYGEAYTPWDWHKAIFARCKDKGIIGFSTPFDDSSVEFLESLNVPFYKIASFENTDLPLIKKIAATGKPIIMSTGLTNAVELTESVAALREAGCQDIVLLKCTSSYPASPDDINLRTIPHMRELFHCQVGLSDHTMGIGAAVAAIALGATVIEKHFTLSRADGGVDSAFSLEPGELRTLTEEIKNVWKALGNVSYERTKAEDKSLQFRRSLYIVSDVAEGECLTRQNMRSIRPGYGLPPKYYDLLLGKKVKKSLQKGTALTWDILL